MERLQDSQISRTIPLLMVVFFASFPACGKYGGGSGIADDPYLVHMPVQMNEFVAEDHLIGWWKFDEGGSTVAADSSGNGHDGTITGAVWSDGKIGKSLDFHGERRYVTIDPAALSPLAGGNQVTVTLWQYGDMDQPANTTAFQATYSSNPDDRVIGAQIPWYGTVYWDTVNAGKWDRLSKAARSDEYKGGWNHWAFTKDAGTGEMKIYRNGSVWASVTGKHNLLARATYFKIGSNIHGLENYGGRMIDDFRIYDHTLSGSEIWVICSERHAPAKYGGGSGTSEDPYHIATPEDLIALGESPEDYDKHFIMTKDIDLAGRVFNKAVIAPGKYFWNPFGFSSFIGDRFIGVFNGHGHTISHLTIMGNDSLALFGLLCGEVKNMGVVDVNVIGSGYGIGGLVGFNEWGNLTGCYSTGVVSGSGESSSIGGLVGSNGSWRYTPGGSVTNCHSTGAVSGSERGSYVGGLVGENAGSLTNCHSTGAVSSSGNWSYVGGIVGDNCGYVTACYSTGAVSGNTRVGGLAAHNWGTISQCYSTGAVVGTGWDVGGLVGTNDRGITTSYSMATVTGVQVSAGWWGTTPELS